MSTQNVPAAPMRPLTPCRACRSDIPADAHLCSVCGSYQNWLGSLNRSGLILSLLVALVSVLSVAVPVLKTAIRPSRSEVHLLRYYFTDTGVSLVVHNTGRMPGFVSSCKMQVLAGDHAIWDFNFNLDGRSPTRVVNGDSLTEIFFKTDHGWMGQTLNQKLGSEWEKRGDLQAKLYVGITQFDGSTKQLDHIDPFKDFYYK